MPGTFCMAVCTSGMLNPYIWPSVGIYCRVPCKANILSPAVQISSLSRRTCTQRYKKQFYDLRRVKRVRRLWGLEIIAKCNLMLFLCFSFRLSRTLPNVLLRKRTSHVKHHHFSIAVAAFGYMLNWAMPCILRSQNGQMWANRTTGLDPKRPHWVSAPYWPSARLWTHSG